MVDINGACYLPIDQPSPIKSISEIDLRLSLKNSLGPSLPNFYRGEKCKIWLQFFTRICT